jgi:hypothetical protein
MLYLIIACIPAFKVFQVVLCNNDATMTQFTETIACLGLFYCNF